MCHVDKCSNPVRDNLFVCDDDIEQLRTDLEMVAGLHSLNLIEELYVTMARQDRTSKNEGGNGKPTKKVQPLPLRLDASAAVSEVSTLVIYGQRATGLIPDTGNDWLRYSSRGRSSLLA